MVIAIAAIFLKQEIEKYLPSIASDTGVSVEVATDEWQRVQSLIRFYAPTGDGTKFALVDPKDSDYALTARELDADFVRTTDRHFAQMGLAVIGPELDLILRDYACATSIIVTAKLGSGYAVTFSVAAFIEMIRGAIDMLRKLPPRVKIILEIAIMAVILHPRSREKLIEWAKILQERLRESKPAVLSIARELVKYLDEAAKTSRTTREAIKAKLQVRGNRTALAGSCSIRLS